MAAIFDMRGVLRERRLSLPPLDFTLQNVEGLAGRDSRAGAVYEVRWDGRVYCFVAEVMARSTPQSIIAAAHRAKGLAADVPGALPLVIVPYLSPAQLEQIESLDRVSAIDLCGNGIVRAGHDFLVVRSGRPNQFREIRPLKAVYRGTSSLVARSLVVQPRFTSVSDIRAFIERRGGHITLGTVSKALKRLAEDLVIERTGNAVRVLQPDKLLEQLRVNYRAPIVRARWSGKVAVVDAALHVGLRDFCERTGNRVVLSGIASAPYQIAIAVEPVATFYCSMEPQALLGQAGVPHESSRAFPNIELLQTDDDLAFFDPRTVDSKVVSSPVQTWLELATGDKRTREAGDVLRVRLLQAA